MNDLLWACVLWLIAILSNALCDSIKQSNAAIPQDRLWHYVKYFGEWTSRFFSGLFARPIIAEWLQWEWMDEWHYTMPFACFGTLVFLCIPLHWWIRTMLKNYWNKKYKCE